MNLSLKNILSRSTFINRFYLPWKKIYILMLRIQKKLESYLNQNQILKNTNLRTQTAYI